MGLHIGTLNLLGDGVLTLGDLNPLAISNLFGDGVLSLGVLLISQMDYSVPDINLGFKQPICNLLEQCPN